MSATFVLLVRTTHRCRHHPSPITTDDVPSAVTNELTGAVAAMLKSRASD
jgi:hypothetical protein